ncbi:MAG: FAD-dependent hydroxylase [Cyanobacteriota bacterium]|nr:FAD-dependent hydroxylase [Cyanobacteriota bacterium]
MTSPDPTVAFDLAIVGGGIVGLTLAAALKDSGLKIAIIEALPPEQSREKPQAYALSLLSARVWEGVGVWPALFPHLGKFERIQLSDGFYPGVVPFRAEELTGDYLGYVGEHRQILTALQTFLDGAENLRWFCPAEVTGFQAGADWTEITLGRGDARQSVKAKLLIGTDGAQSQIRALAGIQTRGWRYPQACVAVTVQHQATQNVTAFERFWQTGPMGVLPLPGNRVQVVWTLPLAEAQAMVQVDPDIFIGALQSRLGESFGTLELVGKRRFFPVRLMQARRYVQPRLALAGDAAHGCHPVGGQGLNLGIRDSAALAEVILGAHRQGLDIGQLSVLKQYEAWRYPENLVILAFTDFLNRFFSNGFLPFLLLRRLGLELLRRVAPLKLLALRLMTGLLGRRPQIAQQ